MRTWLDWIMSVSLAAGLVIGMIAGTFPASAEETSARPVLFIGDSHSTGSFGKKMDELLRTLPRARVSTFASCGSSPSWWFSGRATTCGYYEHLATGESRSLYPSNEPTPVLTTLLQELNPELVIVELGANLMGASLDHAETTTRQMVDAIQAAGSRCIWVGPPHGRGRPEPQFSNLYDRLRTTVSPYCESFIDSRPMAHYPAVGGDGIHYDHLGPPGRAIARAWAQSVFELIQPRW